MSLCGVRLGAPIMNYPDGLHWSSKTNFGVDCRAMADEVGLRGNELFEWCFDRIEIDIGSKATDAGVDAGRLRSLHVIVPREKMYLHP